jgi:hypothetical protein
MSSKIDYEKDASLTARVATNDVIDVEQPVTQQDELEVFKSTADGENYRTVSWQVNQHPPT